MAPRHEISPISTIIAAFVGWKVFLLAIAAGSCVGPSYDTSGVLLNRVEQDSGLNLATRLTSWDAIYFLQNSRRGYVFEQEWAFGAGLPTLISLLSKGTEFLQWGSNGGHEALLGTAVAHTSHLLSALALYQLSVVIWGNRRLSLLSACLHILSPAGLFLSAPYQESTFALLSFLGYLSFAKGCCQDRQSFTRGVLLLLAGVLFGLATTFRSNGILNGVLFASEAVVGLRDLIRGREVATIRRLVFVGLGGVCVGAGLVVPQVVAYQKFCSGSAGDLRFWCTWTIPSIYSFVQDHYWGVGTFRYWTIPNAPLFMLAGPMIFVMSWSGIEYLLNHHLSHSAGSQPGKGRARGDLQTMVGSMAFIQAILALLALVNYHVQIITRMSSGYPLWYWWLARNLENGRVSKVGRGFTIFMMMYASIQAVLFASFLPPA